MDPGSKGGEVHRAVVEKLWVRPRPANGGGVGETMRIEDLNTPVPRS